jgi:exosortase
MSDPQTIQEMPEEAGTPPKAGAPAQTSVAGAAGVLALLAVFAVLLVLSYWPMLKMTGVILVSSDDMAHGFFAPIVAGFLFWQFRDSILRPVGKGSPWGLLVLLACAALGVMSTLAQSSTFSRFAFLGSLCGCLLVLGGGTLLKLYAFPICLLLFTFPVPDVLYGELTQPLQLLASRLSEGAFELLGYSVIREGNILQLAHMQLSVVEACSGLRSLITLGFFSVVFAYFFENSLLRRVVIVLLAVPAAIIVNMIRITMTGILGKIDMSYTKGTYHDMLGWSGFFLGFLIVYVCYRLLMAIPAFRNAGKGEAAA